MDIERRLLEVRSVKGSIPRSVGLSEEICRLLEPVLDNRKKGHLFLTYEAEDREGVKPFEPQSWSRHCVRDHGFRPHWLYRHSSIIHKLQDGWDFGAVYLRARHRHPSMTSKYAEHGGLKAPEWAEEGSF